MSTRVHPLFFYALSVVLTLWSGDVFILQNKLRSIKQNAKGIAQNFLISKNVFVCNLLNLVNSWDSHTVWSCMTDMEERLLVPFMPPFTIPAMQHHQLMGWQWTTIWSLSGEFGVQFQWYVGWIADWYDHLQGILIWFGKVIKPKP